MIHTILLDMQHVLVPIVAITFVFSIPLLTIYFYFKQKGKEMEERKLMIEKGMVPAPLSDARIPSSVASSSADDKRLQNGLNMLAVALGILVGYLIKQHYGISFIFSVGGSIVFFLGISNLLQSLMFTKSDKKNAE